MQGTSKYALPPAKAQDFWEKCFPMNKIRNYVEQGWAGGWLPEHSKGCIVLCIVMDLFP